MGARIHPGCDLGNKRVVALFKRNVNGICDADSPALAERDATFVLDVVLAIGNEGFPIIGLSPFDQYVYYVIFIWIRPAYKKQSKRHLMSTAIPR